MSTNDDVMKAMVRVMARRCGLEDPGTFAARATAERFPVPTSTGRTTLMLLRALVALECECTVEIVAAHDFHAADVRERIDALAHSAGIAGVCPLVTWPGRGRTLEGFIPDVRLVDHAAGGEP